MYGVLQILLLLPLIQIFFKNAAISFLLSYISALPLMAHILMKLTNC